MCLGGALTTSSNPVPPPVAADPGAPTLKTIGHLLGSMATADPPTTITIRTSTRHLLESMKRPGESYDDLLQELAEEYYPPKLIAELKKRVSEIRAGKVKGVPAEEVYRRWGV